MIVNGGIGPQEASSLVANGSADAVAFGRAFLANPDLPERIRVSAHLNEFDYATAYGGDARGNTDNPAQD